MVNQEHDPPALSGMNEICQYVRRSPDTVLNWIRAYDFPAQKIGGVWESDKDLIDQWRREWIRDSLRTGDRNVHP